MSHENSKTTVQQRKIYIDVAVYPLPHLLTYKLPESAETLEVGDAVLVPLKNRTTKGIIISHTDIINDYENSANTEFHPREFDGKKLNYLGTTPEVVELCKWASNYYGYPLSVVLDTALPSSISFREKKDTFLCLNELKDNSLILTRARKKLCQELVDLLKDNGGSINKEQLELAFPGKWRHINLLAKQTGLFTIKSVVSNTSPPSFNEKIQIEDISLTPTQADCVTSICRAYQKGESTPFLIHGVTGSGKTEVYIEIIRHVLGQGEQALLLVPEISLTPQLIDRLSNRLGIPIATLHSGLTKKSRGEYWCKIQSGYYPVVVGARSSIFAPLSRLGIIIIDEEHDGAYKQFDGVRYNTRDLAVTRARIHKRPVILGSATPSLESYYLAQTGKWHYLSIPSRPGISTLPTIKVVDLTKISKRDMPSPSLSPDLFQALKDNIDAGNQSFLLINRRGFCPYLRCEKCSCIITCPACSVPLTLHKSAGLLMCHHCEFSTTPPKNCLSISTPHDSQSKTDLTSELFKCDGILIEHGAGTERIVDEITSLFPKARIARFDRDTTSTSAKLSDLLENLKKRTIDIMIGTQMLAKGHDLPNVTLVGIIDSDIGLHIPDFRASERIFQLLTQASGRAGRAEAQGTVILQSHTPSHHSIRKTIEADYLGFSKIELTQRFQLRYPPFVRLLRVIATNHNSRRAQELLNYLREQLISLRQNRNITFELLGPAPAPIEKIKNHWRWHLLVKALKVKDILRVQAFIKAINLKLSKQEAKLIIDIDPQDML